MDTDSILARLTAGVRELTSSDKWVEWLKAQAKFHDYSWRNTLLIWMQMPTATRCAGYRKWQDLKRQVKSGERGIAILAPVMARKEEGMSDDTRRPVYFRTVYVFDVSQTQGEELPIDPIKSIGGTSMHEAMERLTNGLKGEGYSVDIGEQATSAKGWLLGKSIVVNTKNRDLNDQFRTLAHEAGHALLGHQDKNQMEASNRGEQEVEAESTAYVVCEALGIDSGDYSFGYVANWGDGKPEEVEKTIKAAMSAVAGTAKRILAWAAPCQIEQSV